MKSFASIASALVLSGFALTAHAAPVLFDDHFDPEMTGPEYLALWQKLADEDGLPAVDGTDPLLPILELGKRNLQWLDAINGTRAEGAKLELSTAATQIGYPMTAPKESNRTTILTTLADVKAALPTELAAVLFGTGALPPESPVSDAVFLEHSRKVDRVYQGASRWLLQEPYLSSYEARAATDIRGYYFLSREEHLDETLRSWTTQTEAVKARLTLWLISQCRNADTSAAVCGQQLNGAAQAGNMQPFFARYQAAAAERYGAFFKIQNARPDAAFSRERPNSFELPFQTPERADVKTWLSVNIGDEWRFGAFQLSLSFRESGNDIAHVLFEAGATPHVNGLGGSEITMDANRNIQEYTTRWTIRHEFGHVIGYPDCYVEFYDASRGVMINYQLDVENLMCSRKGHIQSQHIDELKRAYWH